MTDLVSFLTARLDEDEAAARRAAGLVGVGTEARYYVDWSYDREQFRVTTDGTSWINAKDTGDACGEYIARWDPARVLAEIAAKRALIDHVARYEARRDSEWGCCHDAEQILAGECPEINTGEIKALRLLAAPYASHADFDESWRT